MADDLVCDGRGWYKTYRQIDDWEWYKTPHMFHIFSHLLNKANFEDKVWQGVAVKRGQLITSVDRLSEQTGKSIRSIRTCLNRLKTTNEITIKTTNRYSIITITKYDSYQSGIDINDKQINKQADKQTTNKRQTNDNNEEVKNIRSIYSVLFENFYKAYPRKIGKTQASKSWEKIPISEEVFNEIMAGLANYIQYEWKGKEMKYIPHAATWLNQERWKDEVTVKKEDSDYL